MLASRVQNTENNGFPNDKFYNFQNGKFLFNPMNFPTDTEKGLNR